jgi:tRNA (guanine37-N1)-methyltransferase
VPAVLMSGNHAAIEAWRMKQSLGRTWRRRPELLAKLQLTPEQAKLLEEYKEETKQTQESIP